jgi:anti-sigma B factor antagonist
MSSDLDIECQVEQGGDESVIRVRGTLTFEEAPYLHEVLLRVIDETESRTLRVDLSGVERMDTAGLAVLIEGHMATRKRQPKLVLSDPSPAVEKMFQLAGFVSLMSEHAEARFHEALRRCCGDDPLMRRGLGAQRDRGSRAADG